MAAATTVCAPRKTRETRYAHTLGARRANRRRPRQRSAACHTYDVSRHLYDRVVSHMCMGHVTHKLCLTNVSHVTRMNASGHA